MPEHAQQPAEEAEKPAAAHEAPVEKEGKLIPFPHQEQPAAAAVEKQVTIQDVQKIYAEIRKLCNELKIVTDSRYELKQGDKKHKEHGKVMDEIKEKVTQLHSEFESARNALSPNDGEEWVRIADLQNELDDGYTRYILNTMSLGVNKKGAILISWSPGQGKRHRRPYPEEKEEKESLTIEEAEALLPGILKKAHELMGEIEILNVPRDSGLYDTRTSDGLKGLGQKISRFFRWAYNPKKHEQIKSEERAHQEFNERHQGLSEGSFSETWADMIARLRVLDAEWKRAVAALPEERHVEEAKSWVDVRGVLDPLDEEEKKLNLYVERRLQLGALRDLVQKEKDIKAQGQPSSLEAPEENENQHPETD